MKLVVRNRNNVHNHKVFVGGPQLSLSLLVVLMPVSLGSKSVSKFYKPKC